MARIICKSNVKTKKLLQSGLNSGIFIAGVSITVYLMALLGSSIFFHLEAAEKAEKVIPCFQNLMNPLNIGISNENDSSNIRLYQEWINSGKPPCSLYVYALGILYNIPMNLLLCVLLYLGLHVKNIPLISSWVFINFLQIILMDSIYVMNETNTLVTDPVTAYTFFRALYSYLFLIFHCAIVQLFLCCILDPLSDLYHYPLILIKNSSALRAVEVDLLLNLNGSIIESAGATSNEPSAIKCANPEIVKMVNEVSVQKKFSFRK